MAKKTKTVCLRAAGTLESDFDFIISRGKLVTSASWQEVLGLGCDLKDSEGGNRA